MLPINRFLNQYISSDVSSIPPIYSFFNIVLIRIWIWKLVWKRILKDYILNLPRLMLLLDFLRKTIFYWVLLKFALTCNWKFLKFLMHCFIVRLLGLFFVSEDILFSRISKRICKNLRIFSFLSCWLFSLSCRLINYKLFICEVIYMLIYRLIVLRRIKISYLLRTMIIMIDNYMFWKIFIFFNMIILAIIVI
jgi:hypothetical protein